MQLHKWLIGVFYPAQKEVLLSQKKTHVSYLFTEAKVLLKREWVGVLEHPSCLILDRTCVEWDSRGSAMTNHKKLIDVTASLDRNCPLFHEKKAY